MGRRGHDDRVQIVPRDDRFPAFDRLTPEPGGQLPGRFHVGRADHYQFGVGELQDDGTKARRLQPSVDNTHPHGEMASFR